MKKLISTFIIFSTGALSPSSFALEKVELYLKWKHQFQFAGYYAAIEKGFYEEVGLDVQLIERNVQWKATDKVTEKDGRYGISDSSIILEYLHDRPVVILSSIFQHSPLVLATRKKDHLLGPLELKGKRVMYQKNVDDAVFKIMFENSGLQEEDITYVPHTMNNDDLIDKKVDAISIYSTNQPYYFKKMGVDIHIIDPKNYGVDLYGDILFTSQSEVDNHPARVTAFKKASIRGWYYALNNSEEIVKLIKEKYNRNADLEKLIFEAESTKKIIRSDLIPVGETYLGRLKRIAEYYRLSNEVPRKNIENILLEKYIASKKILTPRVIKVGFSVLFFTIMVFIFILYFNRKLKKEVKNKTAELKKIQNQRDLFFSTMTHELRTPINGIIGSTYFLNEAKTDTERTELINAITHSSQTLLEIVNDILDFSKLDKKKLTLNIENHRLERILNDALLTHRSVAEGKNLDLILESKIDQNLWVKIDDTKFSQIINNLVGNAIKFTQQGEVKVSCESQIQGDRVKVLLSVSDTGKGIDPEELKNLFIPFKQANKKVSSEYGGTGLGLAICKKIVELMGGKIEAINNKNGGMTFQFFIWGKLGNRQENLENKSSTNFPDYSFLKILIVEDSKINATLLERYFHKFNIHPDLVENGKLAIEQLEKKRYDLVFMDNFMPVMRGEEATKIIRSHNNKEIANVFIVGQSANWANGIDPECKKLGMDASLTKPTPLPEIRAILDQYVETHSQQKAS